MHISLKSNTGMTAAQQRVMQETGLVMSHSAALHHLRSKTTLARMQLHRIAGTVSPADAITAATRVHDGGTTRLFPAPAAAPAPVPPCQN